MRTSCSNVPYFITTGHSISNARTIAATAPAALRALFFFPPTLAKIPIEPVKTIIAPVIAPKPCNSLSSSISPNFLTTPCNKFKAQTMPNKIATFFTPPDPILRRRTAATKFIKASIKASEDSRISAGLIP